MGLFSKLLGISKSASSQLIEDDVSLSVESSVTMTTRYIEVKQHTKGLLPSVSLATIDGYVSPSGGFVNFARFQVTGMKPETKRKNKRIYEVRYKEEAVQLAEKDGLVAPFEVAVLPQKPPTERQLAYAKVLEAVLPDGACSLDVSAIISRITDNEEEMPREVVARQAHLFGVNFSRYFSTAAIMRAAEAQLSVVEYSNFVVSIADTHKK